MFIVITEGVPDDVLFKTDNKKLVVEFIKECKRKGIKTELKEVKYIKD